MAHPGRPTKYKPEYCDDIIDYFSGEPYSTETTESGASKKIPNDLPLIQNYAKKIGVCVDTLNEWTKVHPAFSEAYKKARALQEAFWTTNSLHGLYSPAFTIFAGKNMFGWRDKQEHEHTGKDGGPIETKAEMTLDEATRLYLDALGRT